MIELGKLNRIRPNVLPDFPLTRQQQMLAFRPLKQQRASAYPHAISLFSEKLAPKVRGKRTSDAIIDQTMNNLPIRFGHNDVAHLGEIFLDLLHELVDAVKLVQRLSKTHRALNFQKKSMRHYSEAGNDGTGKQSIQGLNAQGSGKGLSNQKNDERTGEKFEFYGACFFDHSGPKRKKIA